MHRCFVYKYPVPGTVPGAMAATRRLRGGWDFVTDLGYQPQGAHGLMGVIGVD